MDSSVTRGFFLFHLDGNITSWLLSRNRRRSRLRVQSARNQPLNQLSQLTGTRIAFSLFLNSTMASSNCFRFSGTWQFLPGFWWKRTQSVMLDSSSKTSCRSASMPCLITSLAEASVRRARILLRLATLMGFWQRLACFVVPRQVRSSCSHSRPRIAAAGQYMRLFGGIFFLFGLGVWRWVKEAELDCEEVD